MVYIPEHFEEKNQKEPDSGITEVDLEDLSQIKSKYLFFNKIFILLII